MPPSPAFLPESRHLTLGGEFFDPVEPADFPQAVIRFRNDRIAARVGLDGLSDEEWIAAFGRFEPLPGAQPQPLALRYHGHQFRSYNPQLGDGRGFLYAQLREAGPDGSPGRLLDLGTKGSGRTPWSRDGDGRLTLKGGVREVLATEMLEALGVPTSKSFSLIETGESLHRYDEPSPTRSAVLTRLSWSHVRFGSFQRLAYYERADLIGALVDYVVDTYYPELADAPAADRPAALLRAVTERSARLAARWIAAGFTHGVLNTDNMNVTGESFDYGPYRFVPRYDPGFTAAYFDETGLYAFGRQAEAVYWNLGQLAGCLTLVTEAEPLVEILNGYGALWQAELRAAVLNRLGLKPSGDEEAERVLASATFSLLGAAGEALRWEPLFFDWFGGTASQQRAMAGPRAAAYEGEAFEAFRAALGAFEPDRPERLAHPYFARSEPEELLYDEIETLWAAIAGQDDWAPFHAKIAAIGEARDAMAIAVP
jgi:uncharacterized protein YdiU (UPF0061 family)